MVLVKNEFKTTTENNTSSIDQEMKDVENENNIKDLKDLKKVQDIEQQEIEHQEIEHQEIEHQDTESKDEEEEDVDYISETENENGGKAETKIKEKIDTRKAKKCLDNTEFEKYSTFQIVDERDFSPIFDSIVNNNLVSEEMKNISKELRELLTKKNVVVSVLEDLIVRLIRYYRLNVSTLALHTYNPKVRGDIENITKILKSFVLKNRNTISEYTRHVIIEKKATDCEFNISISAADLHLFDIFEKVSLNNLEQDVPKAKTVFYDIYMSWVLIVIIAMCAHNSKYNTPEDAKKTIEAILKDKIVALNTDSTNPVNKKLINVVKKEKAPLVKAKKVKEIIPKEEQEAIKKLSKDRKKKTIVKGQVLKSIDHSSIIEEVNNDLKLLSTASTSNGSNETDFIAENDLII
ncbi:hypothetical protein Yalta_045 [Yalta virus]|nr:hypothetical protein Yalta_045 [Yalta virus]